jgi:hypothetical protein
MPPLDLPGPPERQSRPRRGGSADRLGELSASEDSAPEAARQPRSIALASIAARSETQMRVIGIDPETVNSYADDLRNGAVFPPVKTFFDGTYHHLSDGFHRVEAHRQAGHEHILADVLEGTSRDAMLAACAANATHGLRRTNEDKRRAILALLRDPEWSQWSDRKIAEACMVDHKSVGKVRRELTAPKSGEIPTTKGNGALADGDAGSSLGMVERLLATIPTPALIAELRRRGVEADDA